MFIKNTDPNLIDHLNLSSGLSLSDGKKKKPRKPVQDQSTCFKKGTLFLIFLKHRLKNKSSQHYMVISPDSVSWELHQSSYSPAI